jgi:hypothetical protein
MEPRWRENCFHHEDQQKGVYRLMSVICPRNRTVRSIMTPAWLPNLFFLFLLGLAALGLMFAFVAGCEKV